MSPYLRPAVFSLLLVVSVTGCATTRQYALGVTGAGQALSRVTSEKVAEVGPAISPDGRTLLFDTRGASEAVIVSVDPNSGARRTVYTSNSSRAMEPAWDPQGRFFVYTTNAPGTWSLVKSLSSSANAAVSIVASGDIAPLASDPSVSPDGAKVAFATFVRLRWQIATVNVDGSNLTLFGEGRDPSWSPDGRRLAFVRVVNGRSHIFTVDANTGTDVAQMTSGESNNAYPAWSPDGIYLAFASSRSAPGARAGGRYRLQTNTADGRWNVFVMQTDGTQVVQLTDGAGVSVMPEWSRDGWLYFSSDQAGNMDIWRLRPALSPSSVQPAR